MTYESKMFIIYTRVISMKVPFRIHFYRVESQRLLAGFLIVCSLQMDLNNIKKKINKNDIYFHKS